MAEGAIGSRNSRSGTPSPFRSIVVRGPVVRVGSAPGIGYGVTVLNFGGGAAADRDIASR
jgi:hypothetical protein